MRGWRRAVLKAHHQFCARSGLQPGSRARLASARPARHCAIRDQIRTVAGRPQGLRTALTVGGRSVTTAYPERANITSIAFFLVLSRRHLASAARTTTARRRITGSGAMICGACEILLEEAIG